MVIYFQGSGVGKTTTARVLAKTLNCLDFKKINHVINVKIVLIYRSRSLDVIELDGASNRGIDEIRESKKPLNTPISGKYKIYIIDEVHMLTKKRLMLCLKLLKNLPVM